MITIIKRHWCKHCKQVCGVKYHNTTQVYCVKCKRDYMGNKVYTCGVCGLDNPENMMHDELTCTGCYQHELVA